MNESPDYSKYSVDELLDAFFHIDHDNFPDRVESIKNELKKHQAKIPSLDGQDIPKALKIIEEKKSSEVNATESDKTNQSLTVFAFLAIGILIWIFLPDNIRNLLSIRERLGDIFIYFLGEIGIDPLYGLTVVCILITLSYWNNLKKLESNRLVAKSPSRFCSLDVHDIRFCLHT